MNQIFTRLGIPSRFKPYGNGGAWARSFAALWAVVAMGLGVLVSPAEAQPFAYVANGSSGTVSVIDTATNTVVATIGVGMAPDGVAVTPNGTHVYVANASSNTVSVIRTATNVVHTVGVGTKPVGVAISPDGTHVYVANLRSNDVSVIARPGNTVVATIPMGMGTGANAAAVTPDGTHVYVANRFSGNVSVINTATNAVDATVTVGNTPFAVGIAAR